MTKEKITQSKLTQQYVELVTRIINISETYLCDARLDDALQILGTDIIELLERELLLEEMVCIQIQRAKIMRFKNRLDNSNNDAILELLYEAEETVKSLDNKRLLAEVVSLIGLVIYDQEL